MCVKREWPCDFPSINSLECFGRVEDPTDIMNCPEWKVKKLCDFFHVDLHVVIG